MNIYALADLYELYRDKFGRESVCNRNEIDAIAAHLVESGVNGPDKLDVWLDHMHARVGQPAPKTVGMRYTGEFKFSDLPVN